MMQLLVIVLNKLECLDKLLTALEEEHIPGATILDSRGMAQQLEGHDELRFLGACPAPPRARVCRPPRGGGVHPGRLVCDPGRGRGISDRAGGDPFAHRGRAGAEAAAGAGGLYPHRPGYR